MAGDFFGGFFGAQSRPMGNAHRRNKALEGRSALSGQQTSNPTGAATALSGVGQFAAGLLRGAGSALNRMNELNAENRLAGQIEGITSQYQSGHGNVRQSPMSPQGQHQYNQMQEVFNQQMRAAIGGMANRQIPGEAPGRTTIPTAEERNAAAMNGAGAMQGVQSAFRSGLISDQPGNWADRLMADQNAERQRAMVAAGDEVMAGRYATQEAGRRLGLPETDNGEGMYVRQLSPEEQRGAGGFTHALTRRPGDTIVDPNTGKPLNEEQRAAYGESGSPRIGVTRDEYYKQRKANNDARIAKNRAAQGGYSDRQLRRMKPAAMASALMAESNPKAREKMLGAMSSRKAEQVLDMMRTNRRQLQQGGQSPGGYASTSMDPRESAQYTVGGDMMDSSKRVAAERVAARFGEDSQMGEHLRSVGLGMDSSPMEHLEAGLEIMQQTGLDATTREGVLRAIADNVIDMGIAGHSKNQGEGWANEWAQQAPGPKATTGELYAWFARAKERMMEGDQAIRESAFWGPN